MTRERTPLGQFTGVTRLSGLEVMILSALASAVGVIGTFVLLYLVGR